MKDYCETVEIMLRRFPETRDDDLKLFCCVCKAICPHVLKEEFARVLYFHEKYDLPSIETIGRARRKLQNQHPELRGKLYEKRMSKQDEYIETFGRKAI